MMWHPYGMGMGFVATIGLLAPLGLIGIAAVLLFVLLVRGRGTTASGAEQSHAAAKRILAERYARGEIDETEYLRRTGVLDARPAAPTDTPPTTTAPRT